MTVRIIKSVMTPFPYSIDAGASLAEADRMMRDHRIHHLPVKQGNELVGVVRAGDLERASSDDVVTVVMQSKPYVVELGSALEDILTRMANENIECVLVTKDARLAGIFTVVDACRAFARELATQHPEGGVA